MGLGRPGWSHLDGVKGGISVALTDEGIINVPGMASRWVRLANGARAHYVTAGDSGPAIILLHGGPRSG